SGAPPPMPCRGCAHGWVSRNPNTSICCEFPLAGAAARCSTENGRPCLRGLTMWCDRTLSCDSAMTPGISGSKTGGGSISSMSTILHIIDQAQLVEHRCRLQGRLQTGLQRQDLRTDLLSRHALDFSQQVGDRVAGLCVSISGCPECSLGAGQLG